MFLKKIICVINLCYTTKKLLLEGIYVSSLLKKHILVAGKKQPADFVIKQAKIVNVFTKEIMEGDVAICDGKIVGIGQYEGNETYDAKNQYLVPGLIDGHVHIESSLLSPKEFAKVSLLHGVTTVITDPHEIGNVARSVGLDFMMEDAKNIYFLHAPFLCPCDFF
jgi:adenine deaminase